MLIERRARFGAILALVGSAACALVVGCVPRAYYASALVQVGRSKEARDKFGEGSKITTKENTYLYEDGLLSAALSLTKSSIDFRLQNKTDDSLKVIWDKTVFIDENGDSSRVAHRGVKRTELDAPQPPTVVPGHGVLTDYMVPTTHMYRSFANIKMHEATPGGWEESELLQPSGENEGKRFGVIMPISVRGTVSKYSFWFEVQKITPAQSE